jgi:hypothetical protein
MKNIYLSLILSVVIIQSATAQWTRTGSISSNLDVIQIGNISTSYTPTMGNWGNLILNSQDYSSIAFHHSGNRVDFIRAGNGTIQLGYDGGWGMPNIGLPNGIWTAGGFVGIATTTPKLQLQVGNSAGVQTALGTFSEFTGNHYFDGSNWRYINDGYGSFIEMNSLDGGINFRNSPSGLAGATSNPTSRMFIANDGRVGIGTSAPGFLLDIKNTGSTTPGIGIGNGTGNFLLGVGITAANANEFGIYDATAGMARFTLNSIGNIGIGTTTPSALLTVSRSGLNTTGDYSAIGIETTGSGNIYGPALYLNGTSGTNGRMWELISSGTLDAAGTGAAGNFAIYDINAGTRFVINSSGQVGIGTTTPGYKLDVNGMGNFSGINLTAQSKVVPDVDIAYGTIGTGKYIGQYFKSTDQQMHFYNGTGGADVLQLDQNNNNILIPNGNVGIGTLSPGSQLTIRNANAGISIESGSGNYFGTLAFNRESKTGAIFNSSGNAFQINNGGADQNLHIQVYHGDGSLVTNNALVIAGTNGNVGIGTVDNTNWQLANSTYKLAVSGNVIAESVTVKLYANWPDYVFKPKYALMPLTDVKSYIDKNHHLPDMPSAAQVEKDGLNLGEINKLLLKKVEELTLYLIEKDKNEKQQKVINSDLQTQIADQNDKITKLEKQLELILQKSK